MLSKTRSLRHIHVALGLRHPWLRTVLENPPRKAAQTTEAPSTVISLLCPTGIMLSGVASVNDLPASLRRRHGRVLLASDITPQPLTQRHGGNRGGFSA